MRILNYLAITAIFLATPLSAADTRINVYRCVLDSGHISYQQIPCHYKDKPIAFKDKPSGWSPLRPGERALLNRYRAKDAARRRKPAARQKKPDKEARSCWARRKQLESVRSKLRHGYKLGEGNELHRKRDNHEDYLRQFCP